MAKRGNGVTAATGYGEEEIYVIDRLEDES
jgi:hypothetical protein